MITYYHQMDPFLIELTSNFGIRWYSLAYIAGVLFAYFAGRYLIRKDRLQIPESQLMDIVVYGAIGAVLGGRLGYCVFYDPGLFLSFDTNFPFWGAIKIHQGGMSSHGGILGFLIMTFVYTYYKKLSFFSVVDLAAFSVCVGIFFGRIANFINGELYGRVVEGKTWLAVRFPTELYEWAGEPELFEKQLLSLKKLLPTLESLFSSSARIPSSYVWEDWVSKAVGGDSVYEGYISYICSLIVQSADLPAVKEILEPLLFLRYPSQLYQSFFGGFLTFLILCLVWIKPRKAGMIGLVWGISYLSFRVFTEFYRQADAHIGLELFDLTRGQWLSLSLFLVALLYAYFLYRQKPKGFRFEV